MIQISNPLVEALRDLAHMEYPSVSNILHEAEFVYEAERVAAVERLVREELL